MNKTEVTDPPCITSSLILPPSSFCVPRRAFLAAAPLAALAWPRLATAADSVRVANRDLIGKLGITTGSFTRNLSPEAAAGKLVLLDLPRIMRDELDLTVIDLMTATLPSLEAAYCERFRAAAAAAGCVVTNLKMNQKGLDLASPDDAMRRRSLDTYKQTIDAAARLGCRWVRPASTPAKPDLARLASGLRELIDYAVPKGITLLVENNGWMSRDADSLPRVIAAVGEGVAAQPDTGNWAADVRYAGLEKAFPLAVTCDFKAFQLGVAGEHADYDLRRCFDIAWRAGFRGPWCFEHFNEDLTAMWHDLRLLRDLIRRWTKESEPG